MTTLLSVVSLSSVEHSAMMRVMCNHFVSVSLCLYVCMSVCGCAGFSVQGSSKAQIECHDNKDGSADVTYLPTVAGQYAVHVLCNNEDINGSPFIVNVHPPPHTLFDPSQVSLIVCLSVCLSVSYSTCVV